MEDLLTWYSSSGRIELQMTLDQAEQISHSSDCFDNVEALLRVPEIKQQFDNISIDDIYSELKESGAWNKEEIYSDVHMSKCRLLWIAGNDLIDERIDNMFDTLVKAGE